MPRKKPFVLHFLSRTLLPRKLRNSLALTAMLSDLPQPLILDDRNTWNIFWRTRNQPWRTQPEISKMRQKELELWRTTPSNIEKGIYPFKGKKLDRADIEWLLATHEDGRGPVNWSGENQRDRDGLDLRGADLSHLDLRWLPLARLHGWLIGDTSISTTQIQKENAVLHLEGTDLRYAHLEGADLRYAHLEGADLRYAHLEGATLRGAHLAGKYRTNTEDSLQVKGSPPSDLPPADLRMAYFDSSTVLNDIVLVGDVFLESPRMADIRWGNANLTGIPWAQLKLLGDEQIARQKKHNGKVKDKATRLNEYETAIRTNRQLAVALQNQGLNENAAYFAYHAQILERTLFWMHRAFGKWLFSVLLALLAGYGYRMWRILVAYLIIVSLCAGAYFVIGMYHAPHLTLLQAFLESITAFHGRVFYELFTPDTPQIWVTAFEAIAGLVIESVFIAMLTQRFFGR